MEGKKCLFELVRTRVLVVGREEVNDWVQVGLSARGHKFETSD